MNTRKINEKQTSYITEKLVLKAYRSACAIKKEIRDKIQHHKNRKLNFCGMRSQGAFILLCFKKREEKYPEIENKCECFQYA